MVSSQPDAKSKAQVNGQVKPTTLEKRDFKTHLTSQQRQLQVRLLVREELLFPGAESKNKKNNSLRQAEQAGGTNIPAHSLLMVC